ncbi:SCO2400 family protein [Streptomyces formicae]|uniref:SCO2400 family protein n=1 Tax=Streptomyces formicae TaxID=1616117 RepID=UPI001F59F29F|nr:hypothetical protein [Streptomyces formicae]
MDYCYQCRRHLNGALACAGCGTPAEELRHLSPTEPTADVVVELGGAYEEDRSEAGRRRAAAPGRRARRTSGARRRRKRGRNVLIGTVGLALVAGALSLGSLAREAVLDDGTSQEVREEEDIAVDQIPDPVGSEEPAPGPSEVSEAPATSSASPRPSATGTGQGSGSPTAAASSSAAAGPTGSSAPPSSPGGDASSPAPGPSGSPPRPPATTGPPGQPSSPPSASPTPSPSESCPWIIFCW